MMNAVRGALIVATFGLSAAAVAAELDTPEKKTSYMIGMDFGDTLKQLDEPLDMDVLMEAMRAFYEGQELQMTAEEADVIRREFFARRQAKAAAAQRQLAEDNRLEAEAFLAANAQAEGVQVTESGLQYKVHTPGDGPRPAPTDEVTVHYRGSLLDGTEFDSSFARNQPMSFRLNRVISGWTEGLSLMPVGSKYTFWIPPALGYGESGSGKMIPPNALLVFEVELLSINTQ